MKSTHFFVLIILSFTITGCTKEETMIPSSKIKASFEIQKEIFDDGEAICFENTSEDAQRFYWELGNEMHSIEKDPIISIDLAEEISKTVPITLHAYCGEGYFDSFTKSVIVSKRILLDFRITKMVDELRSSIAMAEGKKTYLLGHIGPVKEVDGWSPLDHALPKRPFNKYIHLPYTFNLGEWHTIAMNNEEWYLRLSTIIEGERVPRYLKEFRFNPTKQIA
ncbi:MAG: hypothetical protein CVT98_04705, partial [Bacteroidetes bacterium HGW-Bacteroidetes-15]